MELVANGLEATGSVWKRPEVLVKRPEVVWKRPEVLWKRPEVIFKRDRSYLEENERNENETPRFLYPLQ